MSQNNRLTMRLKGISPENISVSMLGEYLDVLSSIYGKKNKIIYKELSEGSVCIDSYATSDETYHKVVSRTQDQLQPGKTNFDKLTKLLDRDKISVDFINRDNIIIGSINPKTIIAIQEIHKKSKVQGRLYSIGGKGESISIKIQGANNESYTCTTTVSMATQLSQYLFKYIRVLGKSTWEKKLDTWVLKTLYIEKFEELKETTLISAIDTIAKAGGNKWNSDNNPDETIRKMRDSD